MSSWTHKYNWTWIPGLKIPSPPSSQPITLIIFLSTASSIKVNTGATSYVYLMDITYVCDLMCSIIPERAVDSINISMCDLQVYSKLYDSQIGFDCFSNEACHHRVGLHPCVQLIEETGMTYRDGTEIQCKARIIC